MSPARRYRVPNRLRAMLFDGGGKQVNEALADAEARLSTLAEACDTTVRNLIVEIESAFGPASRGRERSCPRNLYNLVARIIDSSISQASPGLAEICVSFCDLLDRCEEQNHWDWPAVDVHIAALHLLSADASLPAAARLRIVSGLAQLRQRRAEAADSPPCPGSS